MGDKHVVVNDSGPIYNISNVIAYTCENGYALNMSGNLNVTGSATCMNTGTFNATPCDVPSKLPYGRSQC